MTKKSTRDPTYPPNVRRAKNTARDIVVRVSASIVGGTSSDDEDGGESNGRDMVGSQKRATEAGARGKRKWRNEGEELVRHVDMMSEALSGLVKTMVNYKPPEVDYGDID